MTQGKCPLEMRRTTSMSHFRNPPPCHGQEEEEEEEAAAAAGPVPNFPPTTPLPSPSSYGYGYAPPLGNPSSPQEGNRSLPLPPVGFLEACFFCKRHLGQSRDIFIYRGDRAFCSVECRHQQIVVDERKEKLSASTSPENKPSATTTSAHPNLPATVPLPTGTRAAA